MKKFYLCSLALTIAMFVSYSQTLLQNFPTTNGSVNAITKLGTTIYIGGDFTLVNSQARSRLAAFDAATGALLPWNPGADGPVNTMSTTSNTIYLGGSFTNVGGQSRTRLAAIDAVSGTPTAWNPIPNSDVFAIVATSSAIYIGGGFTSMLNVGNPFVYYIAKLDPVTAASTPFSGNDRGTYALALDGTRLFVGGDFTSLGGPTAGTRYNIGAVDAATGNVVSWNPGGTDRPVFSVAVRDNTVYAGGVFTGIGYNGLSGITSTPRNGAASFDATTGSVLPWNPNINGSVTVVAPSANGVFVGGTFSTVSGQPRNNLALVDAVTGAPLPWAPNPNGIVLDMLTDGDKVFVCGNFTTITGASRSNLAVLSTVPAATYTTIPAKIEAENWTSMSGVQTEPTGDEGGGLNVGYIDNGDWMEYNIYAPSTGMYVLTLRLATPSTSNPRVGISLGDTLLTDSQVTYTGSFQTYSNFTFPIQLTKGTHTLRLTNTGYGYWNINWLQFVLPQLPDYTLIPAKIEAERWSDMHGVQTEPTADAGGGENVGYIDNGDWMDYKITAPSEGWYTLNLRLATPSTSNPHLDVQVGSTTLASIDVPNTGGFQNWQTIPVQVYLKQGSQNIRIVNTGYGYWNINWLEFVMPSSPLVVQKGNMNNDLMHARARVNVYPNPINQNFVLELHNLNQGKVRIDVLNMGGKTEKTFYLNKGAEILKQSLSLQGLPSGQYILQVEMNGYKETKKVLKF